MWNHTVCTKVKRNPSVPPFLFMAIFASSVFRSSTWHQRLRLKFDTGHQTAALEVGPQTIKILGTIMLVGFSTSASAVQMIASLGSGLLSFTSTRKTGRSRKRTHTLIKMSTGRFVVCRAGTPQHRLFLPNMSNDIHIQIRQSIAAQNNVSLLSSVICFLREILLTECYW